MGTRSDTDLKKLVTSVDTGTCDFVTDEWGGFFRVLPEKRHFYGKDLTFPIEATNSDIRHRLARFHRRSKVTSRSLAMVQNSLLLFHHLQSQENLKNLLNPILTFFS
jgi:insertion element IS1 protein InsB